MSTTTLVADYPVLLAPRTRRGFALPTLVARRLALTLRTPRAVLVPMLGPVMFALVVAPALANAVAPAAEHKYFMTFFCIATAGLLIPLNCIFSGLGVVLDRQQGALRELLVAPIRRESIVFGNLLAALAVTAMQIAVLIGASVARGAVYAASARLLWFGAGVILLVVVMYAFAEILATRLDSPEEYTAALPAVAIVPFFFAGSLYPITSLPHWLTYVAKALPLTHALALFRFGITHRGGQALRNIWGLSSLNEMAALSLLVLAAYAALATFVALRAFKRRCTT